MAKPLGSSSSFILPSLPLLVVPVLFTFSLFRPSFASLAHTIKATDDVIKDVCRHTQDAAYCVAALKSHPEAAGADLPGLAKIAADMAHKTAEDASVYASSLSRNRTSMELRQRYVLCYELLLECTEEIRAAREELKSKDYTEVCSAALEATEEAQSCQDELKMPPPEPSQLPHMITKSVTLSSAIFFIAGRLIKYT